MTLLYMYPSYSPILRAVEDILWQLYFLNLLPNTEIQKSCIKSLAHRVCILRILFIIFILWHFYSYLCHWRRWVIQLPDVVLIYTLINKRSTYCSWGFQFSQLMLNGLKATNTLKDNYYLRLTDCKHKISILVEIVKENINYTTYFDNVLPKAFRCITYSLVASNIHSHAAFA